MKNYRVAATALNIRSTPNISGLNRIAVLPQGLEVEKLNDENDPWWLIRADFGGSELEGFVHSNYLEKITESRDPDHSNMINEVHLEENRGNIKRNKRGGWAYPLGALNRPSRDGVGEEEKVQQIGEIIEWLDVEKNKRYLKRGSTTYCNIYAYDYCYLSGAYIPRVWWNQQSLLALSQGETVSVLYGQTVNEMNANSLHDWLEDFGVDFGWQRIFDVTEAQEAANSGKVVIVCAKRVVTNRPGHICAIVPETDVFSAKRRSDGSISFPLQSQAGASNYKYKAAQKWWAYARFQSFGIWLHD